VIYYNPGTAYQPWTGEPDADPDTPKMHPLVEKGGTMASPGTPPTLSLNDTLYTIGGADNGIVMDEEDNNWDGWEGSDWRWASNTSEAHGGDYAVACSSDNYNAQWTVTLTPGWYEVYAWWVSDNKRSRSVPNKIYGYSGTATVSVDQRRDGSQWNQLVDGSSAEFYFDGTGKVSLTGYFDSKNTACADAVRFVPVGAAAAGPVDVKKSHYFTQSSSGKTYLVNLTGDATAGYARKYYEVTATGTGNSEKVSALAETTSPPADIVTGRTPAQERQNFANWFTYYRKRWLSSIAAISLAIPNFQGVRMGYRTINGNSYTPVLPIKIPGETDRTDDLIAMLKYFRLLRNPADTPLRSGLNKVGLYFHRTATTGNLEAELRTSPIATDESGKCQQNFAIVFTDGAWNGGATSLPNGGVTTGKNTDGDNGAPYADDNPNTFADVAMWYYENDLAPDVDNEVPTNFIDKANWQHMVTYGVTFGVNGLLDPEDFDLYNIDPNQRVYPTWPAPTSDDRAKIDDVWHATVNGRGRYFAAGNYEELVQSIQDVINDIIARIGSAASVSVNGEELDTGRIVYQSLYNTEGWTGDVVAFPLDPDTGEVMKSQPVWSAEEQLYNTLPSSRLIATYNGTTGIPFQFDDTITANRNLFAQLDADGTVAENMVDYLRGDPSLEIRNGGSFRNRLLRLADDSLRSSKLGDIVHSAPLFQRYVRADYSTFGVIFVGANDGMLHAFDADSGIELFAYAPGLIFSNLKDLSSPAYSHKYYVDLTPYVGNIGTKALLVGGLGKGGKGYYALNVTDPEAISNEAELAARVEWEFPSNNTLQEHIDDVGYSFSRAFVVKSYVPAHPWVVIFGNGCNSANGVAKLIVLDAETGELLKKIDTEVGSPGAGTSNGLATPSLVDVNNDRIVDYAYAGDLKGNLWKFDLTSSSLSDWEVAYKTQTMAPAPLFTATDENGAPQPITAKPDVMKHTDRSLPGNIVVFGTGKYLGLSDFNDTQTQTIYGIWDYGDDADDHEYLGTFNRTATAPKALSNQPGEVQLLKQQEIYYGIPGGLSQYLRVLSDYAINYEVEQDSDIGEHPNPSSDAATLPNPTHAGWYFDLPIRKERIVRDLLIRGGKVILISTIPDASACSAGGESILMEVDAASGSRLSEAQFDINNDGVIDDADLISIEVPNPAYDPNNPNGESPTITITVASSGLWFPTMLYPPSIVGIERVEIKLMSTAAGGIIDVREAAEKKGLIYWRQVTN